ncbi:uncharacterized protein tasor2 isoform 2-T2 [Lycodopsis pacificus]
MESVNGGASSKGVLVPVSERSDAFQSSILAPLKSAYLYEESRQSFRYKSAVLVKNTALEEKYNAFREKRRKVGYSEEELKESYGFLLFEDINQANALSETGVLTGNSTCTTLGDPSKGVYISMYSDCLDLNRWYHGKSGYIAIIRLLKGRVKQVLENYTQNFTAPTVGFDCHVSEQLPSVSPKTSSFLAFERTQYYMYELQDDGSNVTIQSPSAACPIAIVSFSYTDTKATLEEPQEKGEEKKLVRQYFPWRGQLQIGPQVYDVGLRSTAGALIPAVLPPVVKIDRAISMFSLRQLLPKAAFETCFSGEVFLDGLYCSLCELVSSEVEETRSLSLLLQEIKEKDLALTIRLNDGGFLILLHSTHFLTYDDTGSSVTNVLQGMFVFPNSQVIQRDTKFREKKLAISSEILHVLPVLSYAEGEVEKTPIDPSEELCEVLAQHMQNYASLINPGLASSPTREVSIFPDQYDVPDAHKHLYSSPEWTNKAWQSFRSYLSKPESFQLPLSKASEILAAGQEERMEDFDDDVYICLSSPEGPPAEPVGTESEDQLTGQTSPGNSETPADTCKTNVGSEVDLKTVPQNVVPDDVQAGEAKDTSKSNLSVLIKADDTGEKHLLTPSTSDDLPAELIVSITSAEQTVTGEGLSMISTVSATKHNDFQLSGFSTAKGVNCLHDESVATTKVLDCPEVTNLTKTKRRKLRRGHYKSRKKVSKACIKTHSLKIPVGDGNLSRKKYQAKKPSGHPQLGHPSNSDRRKVQMRKCKFRQLSLKTGKVRSASVGFAVPEEKETDPEQQSLESTIFMDFEASPLRRKTERSDLKPVISECGRILVPHGSVDFADQIKSLKEKFQSTKDEQCPEKMLVDTSVNAQASDKMVQESSPTPETAVGETEATTSKDGRNHIQHVSDVNPEHSILGPSDDGSGSLTLNSESSELFAKTDGTATPPSEAVEGKRTDTLSPGKIAKKGEFLLSKLKSVLLRGKRKIGLLVSKETTADTAQCTDPCLKKGKVDSHSGNLKSNYAITSVQDTVCVKEVSKMLSVDPIFAYALGLTPRETVDKIQKADGRDTQPEQTILDKQPQILHRPSPIFARRGRIKTLKKHQGISTEYVKKKCTPFPVSPLSGSTRLLRHHQTMYGNGIKTLHPSVGQEDSSEQNHRTPEYLKKHMVRRRKFRQSRTFVNKDGAIQVTKQWKEDYDFNLDSKFTNDSKDRTIVRALHGPWDFSLQDTNEEVRLIVHMWIGLFYSRSTDRFFHVDSYPCSEESDSLEVSSGMVSAPAQSELKANSFAPFPSITDTLISKVLDFSKKDDSMLDQGSGILDLSLRNSNAEIVSPDPQVIKKETSVSIDRKEASDTLNVLESSVGPQEAIAKQRSKKMVHSREIINEMNDVRSADEIKRTCTLLQKAGSLEHTNVPYCKGDGTTISVREEMERVSVQPENNQTASGISPVLHGCNNKKTAIKDGIENSEATEMSSVQKHGMDSSKSVTDEEVDSNREAGDVLHTVQHDETEYKDGKNWEVKEKPYQEGNVEPSPKESHTNEDPTNEELGIVCTGNGLENEKQFPPEEPKAVSFVQKHGMDSSKSLTNKEVDSNREVCDVLHTVEHDETETKDGENWKVKEKPYQEGNVEPSPKGSHTNEDPTNEELGIVCTGNGLENEKQFPPEEPKAVSLVQKHGMDSSKSLTNKEVDSNREVCDVLHTVEHDETETKDGENWKVKEKPYQEDNVEPSPKGSHTNEDPTNEELGIVCTGNGLENEKQFPPEEPKAVSLVQKHGMDSSKSLTNKEVDSNREVCDVLHTVEHDETETKDGENWKVKEKPYQEGNVEPSPKGSHTNEDPTNEELGIVCTGNGLENEKPFPPEEPKAVSLVQKHGMDSSKSLTNKEVDSNREVCDVLHTVEHDETETKDGENWKVKEKPYQEGNVEPSPKGSHTNEDPTNEELGIVCNGNGLENEKQLPPEEPKAVSLVQKHGMDSSKSLTNKEVDSNREVCDVLHTVEHDETETKDGENWKVKEKPYQEGNVEPSPKGSHTNEDPTNEELGIVCNGNGLENEKQLPPEEPKAVSPSKAENVNEDVDCCSVHEGKEMEDEDRIGKEDGVHEKAGWISPVDTDSELSDHPVPICDSPNSVKTDCITESNPEPPLDEQPSQAGNKEDPCHDLQLRKLCANGSVLTDEPAISEKCTHAPSEMDPFSDEPAVEKSSGNYICLTDMVHYQKLALPMSDDKCKDGPIPQTNDSVETGSQNKVMVNFHQSSDDHEDWDTKAINGEQKVDNTTEKELFLHQTHSPQCDAEVELTKETDLKRNDKTNEAFENIHGEVVIPFIGIDTSGECKVRPHDSHSQGKVVQDQEEIPFISETTYPETVIPTEVCSASQMDTRKAELSAGKISLIDASDTNYLGGESDDRCSTPTMDEKPYEYITSSGPRSTSVSAFSGSEASKNPHHDPHPDVELRTLRVLQSIDKFLSKSSLGDKFSQIEKADKKRTLDQTTNPRSKNITTCFASSHTSFNSKDKKMSIAAPAVVPASTSQELNTESTGHFLISPFKIKLEEVLGVKLQLQKSDPSVHQHYFERTDNIQETSPGQDYCQTYRSVATIDSLEAINPNVDQDVHTTTSQTTLSHEPRSYSQRPIMAVKPSKSDESQGDYISRNRQIENAVMSHFSKDNQFKNLKVTYTIPATMLSVKNTEGLKRTSEGVNVDKQVASEVSSKSSWLSNVSDSKSQDVSKLNKMPSSLHVQSFESAKSSPKLDGGNQVSVKIEQTTKKSIQMTLNCSDASTSHADFNDLSLGPQSSLTCTVHNNPRKRSSSFLEQVSQRCIQDDLTEASMEQECLIFSERMKHLMKRTKRGPISQQDTHDKLNLPCTSPLTVHFCSLEEQDDSVDHLTTHLDAPLLVGQKIKVDMSERKDLADSTEEEKTLRLQNISQRAGNPMEHAGVSGVTSECARLYKARMKDVCAVKKVPSRPKHFRMDRGYPKTEPGNHFDFCDQMKRELDKSFRSNLNSVVKKSCKTKYRFYILVTSEDAFFEETKAQLEAEGHTAVQPSQFFLDEDSSSSLLIILRNEDIAEHICEVPHLVKLKTSPGVQFAGIDEPDDVVNLTHQELFTRGGFIMFDSAALETLSLCNMKKMSEILQERSRTGRWKWMMHYRDSRRLKENARLSKEAKDKKLFLNFCQEAGILEVLPYHECDLMSRDLPDYLTCLVRLQVQNISARYPIFITDTTTDGAFGKNGILTMTLQSFLTISPSETFTA